MNFENLKNKAPGLNWIVEPSLSIREMKYIHHEEKFRRIQWATLVAGCAVDQVLRIKFCDQLNIPAQVLAYMKE